LPAGAGPVRRPGRGDEPRPAVRNPCRQAVPADRGRRAVSGSGGLSIEPTARVEFGPGVVQRLPEFVADLGFKRAFVVTDRGLRAVGIVDKVGKILDAAGVESAVYEDI